MPTLAHPYCNAPFPFFHPLLLGFPDTCAPAVLSRLHSRLRPLMIFSVFFFFFTLDLFPTTLYTVTWLLF
ncbi:hypothetical protein L227DRAFT_154453 [Lentinus tigrinus ALCF2SS1-6]|uniref:Uncharacterized protein n=1 Tax=Lentinus tigrinus ALCF2SS1-6 TaxID=1328759 RepID=A0A5C2S795_9APHY|nr:hypothetical protein L227DRAFT_154453 [Lentinus tigrinus ALCF2SS1-6]